MLMLRLIVAVVLGIVSFALTVGHWELAFSAASRGGKATFLPMVGGVSGAIAIAIAPWRYQAWWPIPLVLDPGSLPLLVRTIAFHARRNFKKR